MGIKPSTVCLKIIVDEKIYILGTLSFNLQKNELVYMLHYSNLVREQLFINEEKKTPPIDHTTWHSKCVHIRTIDENKRKDTVYRVKYDTDDFLPQIKNIYCIYTEQFIFNNQSPDLLTNLPWSVDNEVIIGRFEKPKDLSIAFLLVPSSWNQNDIMWRSLSFIDKNETIILPFNSIVTATSNLGKILAFPNWDVWILTFLRVKKGFDLRNILGSCYRMINIESPISSLIDIFK